MSLRRQQGVVLIMALFIVALAATLAYVMISRLERDTRRTALLLRNSQAEFYAQGSIAWAKEELIANGERQKGKRDILVDPVPIKSPVNEINGYKITGTIYDMQSRFNLNNLTKLEAQADFKRLLFTVQPTITEPKAQEIALAVTDWISPAQAQTDNSKYYLTLSPAYRAPHELMASASELQLVKGMTPMLYEALKPYITALPAATLINIQTAAPAVMTTLSPSMTLTAAKTIEQLRRQKPIVSPQMFANLDVVKNYQIPSEKVVTISNYFLLETEVVIENQRVLLYTLFERTNSDAKTACHIVWQSKSVPG